MHIAHAYTHRVEQKRASGHSWLKTTISQGSVATCLRCKIQCWVWSWKNFEICQRLTNLQFMDKSTVAQTWLRVDISSDFLHHTVYVCNACISLKLPPSATTHFCSHHSQTAKTAQCSKYTYLIHEYELLTTLQPPTHLMNLIEDIMQTSFVAADVVLKCTLAPDTSSFKNHIQQPSVLWQCYFGVRKSIRPVQNWVMRCWHGYLSAVRCKWFAYGPADAATTSSSLASLKSRLI